MARNCHVERKTTETQIEVDFDLDGGGKADIRTGIGFFDHMLQLFCVHGRFDMNVTATGDLDVDFHHTVEDVGLVIGDAISTALGDRVGIRRYGFSVTPMDDVLAQVAIDLSNRPYLVCHLPPLVDSEGPFNRLLAKEFFRAFSVKAGMNLHINVPYGENEHHILEAIYKSTGRALNEAVFVNADANGVRSTKGTL